MSEARTRNPKEQRLLNAAELVDKGDIQGGLFQLQKLVREGDTNAKLLLAHCYERGMNDVPKDVTKAIEIYESLVNESEPRALENLGRIYMFGLGVQQDYDLAFRYYSVLANAGEPISQFVLGVMYFEGLIGPKDTDTAYAWFKSAAEGGHLYGARNLAVMETLRGNLLKGFAGMVYWTIRILYTRLFHPKSQYLRRK